MKPILFSASMVQSLLAGRKTQTRRIIKPQPGPQHTAISRAVIADGSGRETWMYKMGEATKVDAVKCPYGQTGDILYVRETHFARGVWVIDGQTKTGKVRKRFVPDGGAEDYCFDETVNALGETFTLPVEKSIRTYVNGWYKRPGIHMPKDVARLWLRVKNVRVEQAQEISEQDAVAEGIEYWTDENDMELLDATFRNYLTNERNLVTSYASFTTLWQKINGFESWDANPWVWVVEFERIEKPKGGVA